MAMSVERQRELREERLRRWMTELDVLHAVPFVMIGLTHPPEGRSQYHVFVPMNNPPEKALMVEMFRLLAQELEDLP